MGRRNRSRSSSSSRSSCSSESSKSSCTTMEECWCDYSGIYQNFKRHLLMDESLMAAGSSVFINTYSQSAETIPLAYSVPFEGTLSQRKFDHFSTNSPYYPREDGVYVLFFMASDNQSSQYTVFVNGEHMDLTTIGTNSGAGQLVSRSMLVLKKDDALVIRNYLAESGAITQSENIGGFNPTSDTVLAIIKVAPHPEAVRERECEEKECYGKKEKTLFKRLLGDMIYDTDLMLKGFNTHGSFYSKSEQTANLEMPVLFDLSQNVNNLQYIDGSGGAVKILESGYYKVFFMANTASACQFAIFVNGIPINATCTGTNKGAGLLTIRAIIPLTKNDLLSVRNHTSANHVHITSNAGGLDTSPGVSTILTMFKIAPLVAPEPPMWNPKNNCKMPSYKAFRQYLLYKKTLQIDGAQAYTSATTSTRQDLELNESVIFSTNQLENYRIEHIQGSTTFTILRDGIYDVFGDIITHQPAEFTVFINNVPDSSTTFGRDSGGNRTLIRQILKLRVGDVLTMRNYESALGKVVTTTNAGGSYIGQNAMFMLFRMSPIDCKVVWQPAPAPA